MRCVTALFSGGLVNIKSPLREESSSHSIQSMGHLTPSHYQCIGFRKWLLQRLHHLPTLRFYDVYNSVYK